MNRLYNTKLYTANQSFMNKHLCEVIIAFIISYNIILHLTLSN